MIEGGQRRRVQYRKGKEEEIPTPPKKKKKPVLICTRVLQGAFVFPRPRQPLRKLIEIWVSDLCQKSVLCSFIPVLHFRVVKFPSMPYPIT